MTDRALVVGCDAYPSWPCGDLRAAVRDALSVRDWLLRDSGGGLARQDVTLLASCSAEGAKPAADDIDGPASRDQLARAIRRLVEGPEGDRLYVYFAGHGCRTDPLNPLKARDAILLTHADPDDPASASVGIEDLGIRLSMAPFREVILIVDACRDLPFNEPFDLGGLGRDLPPRRGGPGGKARVYLLQATAPGETAIGTEHNGEVRGVVSRALTDGLRGMGSAKVFDDTDSTGRPYQVRWSTLCGYVAKSVRSQVPRCQGEDDLVLAAFRDGSFEPVRLEVHVNAGPATAEELARLNLQITWPVPDDEEDVILDRPGPVPIVLEVPPRRHRITIRAGSLIAKRSFDLYADETVQLDLRRPRVRRGGGRPLPPEDAALGEVDITSNDPAHVLQTRDGAGRVKGTSVERLNTKMSPGSYTAIAIGPRGTEMYQPADLEPGERTSIRFSGVAPGGWPLRPGELAWASPAAWVAGAHPSTWSAPDDSGIVVVAIEADPPESAMFTPVRGRSGNRPMRVDTRLVHSTPPWGEVDMRDVLLKAPCLRGVVTSIVVSGGETSVGLFDLALLDDPRLVVWLDRAQNLLGAGRPGAAETLLTRVREVSPSGVADLLLEGIDSADPPQTLVRGCSPEVAHMLLSGTPWTVIVTPSQD
jgi:hypothetical protein